MQNSKLNCPFCWLSPATALMVTTTAVVADYTNAYVMISDQTSIFVVYCGCAQLNVNLLAVEVIIIS